MTTNTSDIFDYEIYNVEWKNDSGINVIYPSDSTYWGGPGESYWRGIYGTTYSHRYLRTRKYALIIQRFDEPVVVTGYDKTKGNIAYKVAIDTVTYIEPHHCIYPSLFSWKLNILWISSMIEELSFN